MKQTALLAIAVLMCSVGSFASDNQAAESAYCRYVMEQANAQRDLLRSPSAIVGPTQPSAGTPAEMVFGVSGSLANNFKAPLTVKAAHAACELYAASAEAQLHIDFASSKMEKDALVHRIELVQKGSDQLQAMINDEEKMVQAQNVTRPGLYYLQAARARLDMRRTSALAGFVPYVPEMSELPLRQLISNKTQAEDAHQKALTKLDKQGGWDLVISGGGRRQISQFNSAANISEFGGFGEVSLSYNFARHAANTHLDRSAGGYVDYRNAKFDDVSRQSVVLKKQIEETLSFLRPQLTALTEHDSDIEKALHNIEGLTTNNAQSFRNQLLADQIVLRVDIGEIQFRIEWLESYLRTNF